MGVLDLLEDIVSSIQKLGNPGIYRRILDLETEMRKLLDEQEKSECLCKRLREEIDNLQQSLAAGTYDPRQYAVLYVDFEEKSRKCFTREYGKNFRVMTASGAQEGLAMLKQTENEIGIVMAGEPRLPGRNGRWLLERARLLHPRLVRILVSTFPTCSELSAASVAVRSGAIYGYIIEPWDPEQLEHLLRRALEHFTLGRELDRVADALRSRGKI